MTTHRDKLRELQGWSARYWPDSAVGAPDCECGHVGQGPRHHRRGCPFLAWAWEQKAYHLATRDGEPGDDHPELWVFEAAGSVA